MMLMCKLMTNHIHFRFNVVLQDFHAANYITLLFLKKSNNNYVRKMDFVKQVVG